MELVGVAGAFIFFRETPKSAIALARHDLFKSRDRLFIIAESGAVPFDHLGYCAARDMINSYIRYAHELSLAQLLVTRALLKARGLRANTSKWDHAIASLPKAAKVPVKDVLDEAMVTMFRLMVTRSVVLSGVAAIVGVVGVIHLSVRRLAREVAMPLRGASNRSDAIIEDLLALKSGRKLSSAVKQEAKRYEREHGTPFAQAA